MMFFMSLLRLCDVSRRQGAESFADVASALRERPVGMFTVWPTG